MFLDDELLKICEESNPDTPEKVQQLNRDICKKCENYYKSKLNKTSTEKEVKCVLDKTFNLFDSFVRSAETSKNEKLRILSELFKKHTYKNQFLANEEMNEIYSKL